jgi:hypothetical protein
LSKYAQVLLLCDGELSFYLVTAKSSGPNQLCGDGVNIKTFRRLFLSPTSELHVTSDKAPFCIYTLKGGRPYFSRSEIIHDLKIIIILLVPEIIC